MEEPKILSGNALLQVGVLYEISLVNRKGCGPTSRSLQTRPGLYSDRGAMLALRRGGERYGFGESVRDLLRHHRPEELQPCLRCISRPLAITFRTYFGRLHDPRVLQHILSPGSLEPFLQLGNHPFFGPSSGIDSFLNSLQPFQMTRQGLQGGDVDLSPRSRFECRKVPR